MRQGEALIQERDEDLEQKKPHWRDKQLNC